MKIKKLGRGAKISLPLLFLLLAALLVAALSGVFGAPAVNRRVKRPPRLRSRRRFRRTATGGAC